MQPPPSPAAPGGTDRTTKVGRVAFALVAVLVVTVGIVLFLGKRQQRLMIERIRNAHSADAVYPLGDGPSVGQPLRMDDFKVVSIRTSPNEKGLNVAVGLQGAGSSATAPRVRVGLYDGAGRLLGKNNVVNFLFKELPPGGFKEVTDVVESPPGSDPQYYSLSSY